MSDWQTSAQALEFQTMAEAEVARACERFRIGEGGEDAVRTIGEVKQIYLAGLDSSSFKVENLSEEDALLLASSVRLRAMVIRAFVRLVQKEFPAASNRLVLAWVKETYENAFNSAMPNGAT